MAQLPASSYLSNSARTEAEMQTALESLRDVIAEIGATDPQTLTISSGALPAPTSGMVLARSEGHSSGTADVLDTITTTGIDQGRVIVLRNFDTTSTTSASSERITITHGTGAGAVELSDNADFILSGERMIAVIYSGTRWIELWRSYHRANAEDVIAERTHLGLGDAAVETVATSSGSSANGKVLKVGASADLSTNDLLAIDASGNIVTGSVTGGNADTLDTYDSSAFLRKADTATQTLAANVNITTSGSPIVIANTTGTGQTPGFEMQDNGTKRADAYYDQADGSFDFVTYDSGGSATPRMRLNPTTDRLEFAAAGGSFESLRPGAGNGLDADTVDGQHLSQILTGAYQVGSTRLELPAASDVPLDATGGFEARDMTRMAVPADLQALAGTLCNFKLRLLISEDSAYDLRFLIYLDDGLVGTTTVPSDSANLMGDVTHASSGYEFLTLEFTQFLPSSFDSLLIQVGETANSSGWRYLQLYETPQTEHTSAGVGSWVRSALVFNCELEVS